nr:hypothetical protein CFP56_72211 [Quercus suber]
MVDFTFDIEIHVGRCFVDDPTLKYVGGLVHTLTEIGPDKLSFFKIRDLCHLVGAPKEHSRYRYLLPEGNVEDDIRDIETNADVGVAGDGVGGDVGGVGGDEVRDEIAVKSDYDEEGDDDENVEDV